MLYLQQATIALACVGSALAQCGPSGRTTTLESSGDATALASCETYSGSIAIATGATDVSLSGIQIIEGNLVANGASLLTSLAASDLQEIDGEFNLEGLTVLSNLNFPELSKVDTITWTALPALGGLSFTAGVQEANMLDISNTYLSGLDGINLHIVDTFNVENNPYLTSVSMQLGNVSTSLLLNANGKQLEVDFPNLLWAYNLTFRDVSSLSLPSLTSINGSLGIVSSELGGLDLDTLTNVGGSLSVTDNGDLSNITMPVLSMVGGEFQIANNSRQSLSFPDLETVGGALDFHGDIAEVTLAALSDVRGAFNIQSSEAIDSTCSHFSSLSGNSNVIKGKYGCKGEVEVPLGGGTLPDGTNSGSGSAITSTVDSSAPSSGSSGTTSPTSTVSTSSSASPHMPAQTSSSPDSTNIGAIAGGIVGGVVGLAIIAGAILYLMRRKKKQMTPTYPEMQRYPAGPSKQANAISVDAEPGLMNGAR